MRLSHLPRWDPVSVGFEFGIFYVSDQTLVTREFIWPAIICKLHRLEVFKPSLDLPAQIPSCFIFNEKWQQLCLAVTARAGPHKRSREAKTLQTTLGWPGPAYSVSAGGPAARKSSQKQPSWRVRRRRAITSVISDTWGR